MQYFAILFNKLSLSNIETLLKMQLKKNNTNTSSIQRLVVKIESDLKKKIAKLRGKKVNAVVLLRAFSTVIHKIHMVGRTNNIETNNKFTCWTIK